MEKKMEISIYVACHKESYVPEISLLKPIQVGAAIAEKRLPNMLHDDEGKNISDKNKMYAELTAQYWAWKNAKADYYGLFHYRRYLSFNPLELKKEVWFDEKGLSVFDVIYDAISEKALKQINFSEGIINSYVSQYDIIAPVPDKMEMSVYEHYKTSLYHRIEDLDEAIKIIIELHPQYIEAMKKYLSSNESYFCNMFIMKKEYFYEYSSWLFSILEEMERRRDYSDYSVAEDRALAFLTERLFGIYFLHCKERPDIKTAELQRVLFKNTEPVKRIKKICNENSIPIVLACDNNYIKYATASIMSALKNTDSDNFLDVIILERQISEFNKKLVEKTFQKYQNISVRFVQISNALDAKMDVVFSKQYPAEVTYRLFASELLEEYEKFIYLDSDTMVLGDIRDLYEIDLENFLFGMAKDIDFIGHYCCEEEWKKYTENKLELKNPLNYAQSGVMVYNAALVREKFSATELCKMMIDKNYRFPDQDLLNVVGEGKIKDIGLTYNFLAEYQEGNFSRKRNIISKAPKTLYNEYLAAEKAPKIIHFCIPIHLRPWNNPELEYAAEYWSILKDTYFYEIALADLVRNKKMTPEGFIIPVQPNQMIEIVDANGIKIQGVNDVVYIRGVYIKVMQKLNKWFPMGSKKRAVIKKLAGRLFK